MRKASPILLGVTACLILAPRAESGIRLSFDLNTCAWDATHIVVVSEGDKIDGIVSVLESWKGNLKSGDSLSVPGLASFAAEGSRTIDTQWRREKKDLRRPTHVTGSRMVLLLKRGALAEVDRTTTRESVEPDALSWIGAADFGGIKVSVAWIEQDEAYRFVQVMNPGPSVLVPLQLSEPGCKKAVIDFRDFWLSLPQLENKSGLSQMSLACDEILLHLQN